jgi:hypothetical protein
MDKFLIMAITIAQNHSTKVRDRNPTQRSFPHITLSYLTAFRLWHSTFLSHRTERMKEGHVLDSKRSISPEAQMSLQSTTWCRSGLGLLPLRGNLDERNG